MLSSFCQTAKDIGSASQQESAEEDRGPRCQDGRETYPGQPVGR